jgi:hypothetical protein
MLRGHFGAKSGQDGWLTPKQGKRRGEQSRIHDTNKVRTACWSEASFGVLRGLNLLLVCIDRAPPDSEQKITKKRRIYNLRFLRLLLFKISAPSALSAVKPSVATQPRWPSAVLSS